MKKIFFVIILIIAVLVITGFSKDKANMTRGSYETSLRSSTTSWATWKKNLKPVLSGPYHLVGDPSVIKDGAIYRMFYNCYDKVRKRGAICQVTSTDGLNWVDVPVNDVIPGRMLKTRGEDKWDTAHETPEIIKFKGEYLLYFTGYIHKGDFDKSFPYHIGLATSKDAITFERYGDDPILSPTTKGYDGDAVFSPTITEYDGKLVMIYTGFCIKDCVHKAGVNLLAATSDDGRVWTKREGPIISHDLLPSSANDGVGESDIIKGPDDYYYLFMTFLYGGDGHEIGVARSKSPFGPFDVDPDVIIKKTAWSFDSVGPIAPSVIFENGKARMWYHGFGHNTIDIGYAEATLPLKI